MNSILLSMRDMYLCCYSDESSLSFPGNNEEPNGEGRIRILQDQWDVEDQRG